MKLAKTYRNIFCYHLITKNYKTASRMKRVVKGKHWNTTYLFREWEYEHYPIII